MADRDWTETDNPRERVRATVEILQEPKSIDEIASTARVDRKEAMTIVEELREDGLVYSVDEERYDVNLNWLLAAEIRRLGIERAEGVLVPVEVLNELESGDVDYTSSKRQNL